MRWVIGCPTSMFVPGNDLNLVPHILEKILPGFGPLSSNGTSSSDTLSPNECSASSARPVLRDTDSYFRNPEQNFLGTFFRPYRLLKGNARHRSYIYCQCAFIERGRNAEPALVIRIMAVTSRSPVTPDHQVVPFQGEIKDLPVNRIQVAFRPCSFDPFNSLLSSIRR